MDPRQRRHLLVFETEKGLLSLETDDLYAVSEQGWFKEFLNVAEIRSAGYSKRIEEDEAPPQRTVQRPVQQAPAPQVQVAQPDTKAHLKVTPDAMDKQRWDALNPEQQQEYVNYYGLK